MKSKKEYSKPCAYLAALHGYRLMQSDVKFASGNHEGSYDAKPYVDESDPWEDTLDEEDES